MFQVKDYAAELVEPNLAPLSAILQPEDELQFWSGLATSSSCPAPLQQRAAAISSALASLGIKLGALHKQVDMLPEEDMVDFIEDAHQSLEALWEIPLPAAPGVMAVQLVSAVTPVIEHLYEGLSLKSIQALDCMDHNSLLYFDYGCNT